MKKNTIFIILIPVVFCLAIGAFLVYSQKRSQPQKQTVQEEETVEVEAVDPSVIVSARKSYGKENTVLLSVNGLGGKMVSAQYELTYDSDGLIKGVNSGSKPVDLSGQESFEREIYLGTCSKNVCKADPGVQSVSVVVEFVDQSGKKSQFSGDFEL